MTKISFLNKKQKKEILRNIFIENFQNFENSRFIKINKKIYIYTGNLNTNQILELSKIARIESIGIFLFEIK
ncbi:MAG: hypothetical protein QW117_00185 [Candidatus Pacearchaeota archaeon]